ncbi:MAG: PD-(D/E)XK nuclease-like domain-containing protein [Beijerinckiaceae bacterium]|nr:PD-(D/E)XK nuclease-like domain-containing protein [Beijerinckiaceae bacterium]
MTKTILHEALPVIKWTPAMGKVSVPGVYDMPIEIYHSDICEGPSISSSGLRLIEDKSPLHYWDTSPLNPDREPQQDKPYFNLGRAVHTLCLGEDGFATNYVVRPEEFSDWRTNAAKAWRATQIEAGRTVLKPEDKITIKGIADRLKAHPLVRGGILSGEIERSLIWKDAETDVWLKSRPDVLPYGGELVADLKTCAAADADSTRRSINDYGYHMQLALCGIGMKAVLDRDISDNDYALIFAETKRPFAINVKPIGAEAIVYGRMQLRRALRKFADCFRKKEWPGFDDDMITAGLPAWRVKQLEAEATNGMLPKDF